MTTGKRTISPLKLGGITRGVIFDGVKYMMDLNQDLILSDLIPVIITVLLTIMVIT